MRASSVAESQYYAITTETTEDKLFKSSLRCSIEQRIGKREAHSVGILVGA